MAEATGQDRRTVILEQALDLFARHGYAGTGMRAIAKAAGIREATLYHYFLTKEALMEALIAHYDSPPDFFRQFIPRDVPVKDLLFHAGMGFLEAMRLYENQRFLRMMLVEAHHHPGWANGYLTTVYEPPVQALTDALAEAGAQRPRWVAESFLGALLSYVIHKQFLTPDYDDPERDVYLAWLAGQGARSAAAGE